MKAFVSINGLTKTYNGHRAVDDLSLAIPKGEIFGLLGPNGAGKTTIISMLSGLFPPDAGDIVVAGLSMSAHPSQVKALMGVVPQEIALYTTLSARENLHFWGRLYGLRGAKLKERTESVLELVGLTGRAKDPISSYSGGMKRRINIAAGLLHSPTLLLLDEPTVGVDPQSRRAILDMIKGLNSQGMTVLYTSHYMEEVADICSLVAIMDHGRVIAQGTQAELHQLVGDADVVRLEVDGAREDWQFLRALPGVARVDATTKRVDLTVTNGNAALARIITAVAARDIQVSSVSVEQPNLETVFLHLTGRTLRD